MGMREVLLFWFDIPFDPFNGVSQLSQIPKSFIVMLQMSEWRSKLNGYSC